MFRLRQLLTKFSILLNNLSSTERYIVGFLSVVVLASLIAFAVQYYLSNTKLAPSTGGNYREAMIGLPRFINPVLAPGSDIDRDIARLIYPSLLKYDAEGTLVPDLAESYQVLNNGKQYRFIIKDRAQWEDNTPITAADVVFTISLIQDQKYSSPLRQNWIGVAASQEGDRVVIFNLDSPYPPFTENTTVGILPKHIWENVAPNSFLLADANLKPIGGGPFKFNKFQKDSTGYIFSYDLARNDKYYAQKPYLDGISFRFFDSEDEAIRAYNRRAVDAVSTISATALDQLHLTSQTTVYSFTLPRYFAIFFNQNQNPALQDSSVRQALQFATDKDSLVSSALNGRGEKVSTPILPFMPEFNQAAGAIYSFDADRARALLDKAGWQISENDGTRAKKSGAISMALDITLATVAWPELQDIATELQKQWAAVGVRLKVETYQLGELQQNIMAPRNYSMLLFGQVLSLEPDPFSFWHSSQKKDPGLNLSLYGNNNVDKLLENARQEQNPATRNSDLQQFQQILMNDNPAIFLYNPSYLYPANNTIKGIENGTVADPSWRFANITNWYVNTRRENK
ncbi:MAG: hypothetical protein HYV65_03150 [Candidatus Spechtbacteria bacterium]|nr:hypothetical protein [Candidatus Spechtbacteria bacterium]